MVWSPDSRTIYLEAQEKGLQPLWSVMIPGNPTDAAAGGEVKRLFNEGVNHEMSLSPDGRWLAFTHHRLNRPQEIRRFTLGETSPQPLTNTNGELLTNIALNAPESVTITGAGGTPVQMWILKPPNFSAAKKYPLVFWVHGGPQSAFLDSCGNVCLSAAAFPTA